MPVFTYEAMDAKGKPTKGTLEVATQNEAITRVKEMGLFPTKIVEIDKAKEKSDAKITAAAVYVLETMTKASEPELKEGK